MQQTCFQRAFQCLLRNFLFATASAGCELAEKWGGALETIGLGPRALIAVHSAQLLLSQLQL